MKTFNKYILVISLLCFVSGGCYRGVAYKDQHEQKSKIMLKAYAMSSIGDYDSSIILLKKALEIYPTLARPHLDIALLLQDYKHDYLGAMYHYKRYLEMRPGSEKSSMINRRMKQAAQAYVARYVEKNKTKGISLSDLKSENESLKNKNQSLIKKVKALEAEIAGIDESARRKYKESVVGTIKVSDIEKKFQPPKAPVNDKPVKVVNKHNPKDIKDSATKVKQTQPTKITKKPMPTKAKTNNAANIKKGIRTYTVKRGDSLSKIADLVYGDTTKWRRIQVANQDTLGRKGVNVRTGQVLKIPWP